jgi:hypothetical protein
VTRPARASHDLDCDLLVKTVGAVAQVDGTHAALPEEADEAVRTDLGPYEIVRLCGQVGVIRGRGTIQRLLRRDTLNALEALGLRQRLRRARNLGVRILANVGHGGALDQRRLGCASAVCQHAARFVYRENVS